MVKTIHLVRHGHHALLGRVLCGRMGGVELDELGRRQMSLCAERIIPAPIAIQSSPQRRAQQSAGIVAAHFHLPVAIVSAVDEIDLGDWTGRSFDDLSNDPHWQRWNEARGSSRPPNGESMRELQLRTVRHLEQLRDDPKDGTIVIVSHAEPVRSVDPACVSTLCLDRSGVRIAGINQRVFA
jgi:probable phosphoglycerate mutase